MDLAHALLLKDSPQAQPQVGEGAGGVHVVGQGADLQPGAAGVGRRTGQQADQSLILPKAAGPGGVLPQPVAAVVPVQAGGDAPAAVEQLL